MFKTKITSTGRYHPEKIMTNHDIAKIVETSHEWIVERTGIHERRIADPEKERPSDMALYATQKALEKTNLAAEEIELIIFATTTPDYRMPNTASVLQEKLGLSGKCGAVEISVACSGFIYGMSMADAYIKSSLYRHILLVCSEMPSHYLNWQDRKSCILFGDGCGATIFSRASEEESSCIHTQILSSDGSQAQLIQRHADGVALPMSAEVIAEKKHFMTINGPEVFKHAVRTMGQHVKHVCQEAQITPQEINWFVPHQANLRVIQTLCKMFEVPPEKVILNIERFANTSAASIPTALDEAIEKGKVQRGDKICTFAFGAGVTSGANIFTY